MIWFLDEPCELLKSSQLPFKNYLSNDFPCCTSIIEYPWHLSILHFFYHCQEAFEFRCAPKSHFQEKNLLHKWKQSHGDLSLSPRMKLSASLEAPWGFLNPHFGCLPDIPYILMWCWIIWYVQQERKLQMKRLFLPQMQGRPRKSTWGCFIEWADLPAREKMGMESSKQSQCLHTALWLLALPLTGTCSLFAVLTRFLQFVMTAECSQTENTNYTHTADPLISLQQQHWEKQTGGSI